MRLDQWLWAVRVYKSRSLATSALKGGLVTIGGVAMKPAHEVRSGEIVSAKVGDLQRTVRVLGCPESRVGAKRASEFAEDLTPPEEYERARKERPLPSMFRF
jgi:ribosome-associated heat shock protein Hsp15